MQESSHKRIMHFEQSIYFSRYRIPQCVFCHSPSVPCYNSPMENCIFCKIARDEIPSEKVHHENQEIITFPDIHPVAPGHTLVIPVAHYQWFQELPDDISDKLFRTAKRVAKELKEKYKADYVRLSIVGKDVPHTHIHLIPQKFSDIIPPTQAA
jgi:histidine triad (HIT) family protein